MGFSGFAKVSAELQSLTKQSFLREVIDTPENKAFYFLNFLSNFCMQSLEGSILVHYLLNIGLFWDINSIVI